MPEDKKWEIADAADMIVSGFAFKRCGETIQMTDRYAIKIFNELLVY